jgi:hypothetical protein
MHDRLLAAAPIILNCARRGLCRHVSAGMQNGGYTFDRVSLGVVERDSFPGGHNASLLE